MAKTLLFTAPFILQTLPGVNAWGTLGHDTVAYIAQNFVTSATKTFCQNILGDTSTSYLANVATWADTYRYTAEGSFSAPYHFIDAEDNPPTSCNVDYNRDCGADGCVVSAIQNYTSRVIDSSLSSTEVTKALKWIIHFVGDIHQPLHDEALDVGGNTIDVTFDGTSTNLHHIWDTNMPEKLVGGYTLTYASSWASNLTTQIKTGAYKSQKDSWLSGIDLSDPGGVNAVSGKELDGSYYSTAIPVIELQIAKAGYRLAAWLNLIATGSPGLTVGKKPRGATPIEPVKVLPRDENAEMSPAKLARMAYGHKC
ncbi:S1/P1 nuclease [Cenococcum geophilum 1.58]|uniref:S1/P1 nuclease n=1 Tax=Cenococcum geophilum 1.58 TaxID=794803 RepID=UPI00358DFDEF|nr:S1/P1 nuclease [Cenococcum geophilum 1.58]